MKSKIVMAVALSMLFSGASACAQSSGAYTAERERLASEIAAYSRSMEESLSPRVIAAIGAVPRHMFVPPTLRSQAYADRPLPIGRDQTISQPSLVALMTHLLRPDEDDVILEVGTGSGYQAAVLSGLVDKVYSIEIIGDLARQAEQRLDALGYDNVAVRHGDGYLGWPEHAPFDGIIVTAGADHVPAPLVEQLKSGGRIVIPVGPADAVQELRLITKLEDGSTREETITAVRFVPLTRERR